jgi:hypothetical protein
MSNRPRTGVVLSGLAQGTLAALLGRIMARGTLMAGAFVALTPILAGCGSSLSVPPAAPTPAQSPAPGPTVAGERWNLTATVRSITGPEACISDAARMTIGQSFSWLLTIERSGEPIHLSVSDLDDPSARWAEYEGTVVEGVLTAALKSVTGTACGGQGRTGGHVSGRFSGDGRALTGEQVYSFQLSSGDTRSSYYDWSATRQ